MVKTKKDLRYNISLGHCVFTVQNFWNEGDALSSEFAKVLSCLGGDKKVQEEVFAKFVVFVLDYCQVRQMNVVDRIFDSKLFNSGSENR